MFGGEECASEHPCVEREIETRKIRLQVHSQLYSNQSVVFVSRSKNCSRVTNISDHKMLTLQNQATLLEITPYNDWLDLNFHRRRHNFLDSSLTYLFYQGNGGCSTAEAVDGWVQLQILIHQFESLQH